MKRALALAAALLFIAGAAAAQVPNSTGYIEAAQAIPAATWTLVSAARAYTTPRRALILGDAVGLGCRWSFNSAPVTGEGVPFSTTTAAGSYVFDQPTPNNAVYVYCTNAGTLTIAGG